MPDNGKSETYRGRYRVWQDKADALPPGEKRDMCMVIAEGYARLALLIEKSTANGHWCTSKLRARWPNPNQLLDDWLATDRIRASGHQHPV